MRSSRATGRPATSAWSCGLSGDQYIDNGDARTLFVHPDRVDLDLGHTILQRDGQLGHLRDQPCERGRVGLRSPAKSDAPMMAMLFVEKNVSSGCWGTSRLRR